MNVLQISYYYPPRVVWGVGRHVSTLAHCLARAHSVVVATRSRILPATRPRIPGLAIIRSLRETDRALVAAPPGSGASYRDLGLLLRWNAVFADRLMAGLGRIAFRPDVIHNHGWMMFPLAARMAELLGVPLVSTIHVLERQYVTVSPHRAVSDVPGILALEEAMVRQSAAVICPSEATARLTAEAYPGTWRALTVIPHGIEVRDRGPGLRRSRRRRAAILGDAPDAPSPTRSVHVLYVGRCVPSKGIAVFLKCAAELVRRHEHVVFHVLGDGAGLHRLIKEYASPQVRFWGYVDHRRVRQYMRAADVLFSPSLVESFGLSIAEAMACGMAVLTTTGPTVASLVRDGETGLTEPLAYEGGVPSVLAAPLLEKLDRLVRDRGLRESLGHQATVEARTAFDAERMAMRTAHLYAGVSAARHHPPGASGQVWDRSTK
jgi:glycogen synthase